MSWGVWKRVSYVLGSGTEFLALWSGIYHLEALSGGINSTTMDFYRDNLSA